jgi:hypothetical protein
MNNFSNIGPFNSFESISNQPEPGRSRKKEASLKQKLDRATKRMDQIINSFGRAQTPAAPATPTSATVSTADPFRTHLFSTPSSFSFTQPVQQYVFPTNAFTNQTIYPSNSNQMSTSQLSVGRDNYAPGVYAPFVVTQAHAFKRAAQLNDREALFTIANRVASMSPAILDAAVSKYPSMLHFFQEVSVFLTTVLKDIELSEAVLTQITYFSLIAQAPNLFSCMIKQASSTAPVQTYAALRALLHAPVAKEQKVFYYKEYLSALTKTNELYPELKGGLPVMSPQQLLYLKQTQVLSPLQQLKNNIVVAIESREDISFFMKNRAELLEVNHIAVRGISQTELKQFLTACPHIQQVCLLPAKYESHQMLDFKGHVDNAIDVQNAFPSKQVILASERFVLRVHADSLFNWLLFKQVLPKCIGPMHIRIVQKPEADIPVQAIKSLMAKLGYKTFRWDAFGDELLLTLS